MKKIILICVLAFVLLVVGCVTDNQTGTKEEAEKTAERFARYWEQEDWESMYDFFIPELTELRSKEDFAYYMSAREIGSQIVVRLDQVSLDSENLAYVYYTVSSSIYDAKAPAMKLVFNESWKIDALGSAFLEECAEKPCVSTDICESTKCNKSTKFKCIQVPIENCCKFSDSDCPEDRPYCHNFECKKEECFSDSDCNPADLDCPYKEAYNNGTLYWIWECICNPTNNKCVRCISDSDCNPYQPLCDKKRGICTKCVTDADCNGLLCNNESLECVECLTDADCTTTDKLYCNYNGWGHDWPGKCSECLNNTHCPKGYDCVITSYQKKTWGCRND